MNIYRLDPIDQNHPSWQNSSEKDCVWASAPTPKEARDLVADKTRLGCAGRDRSRLGRMRPLHRAFGSRR